MKGFIKKGDLTVFFNSAIFLLFTFSLSFPSFHFVHEYEAHTDVDVHCDDHDEENACHQFIIHHNHESECLHQSHITKKEDHCVFCAQLTLNNTYIHELVFNQQNVIDSEKKPSTYTNSTDFSFYIFTPEGRGPPVLI
jgi:hypothetical protein